MCEVAERLVNMGKEEGLREGIAKLITSMLDRGKTPDEIHSFCGIPIETILEVKNKTTFSVTEQ